MSIPTDSMPTTQSPKREVGTIAQWPQAWVLIGGWCGSECGVFHQQLSMLAHAPIPRSFDDFTSALPLM